MKNEELKKAFEDNFQKEAPADFTQNLMSKVEASQYKYERIIPRSIFWIIGVSFTLICALTIIFQPQVELPFSLQGITSFISDFISLIIMPLVILTLLFLKNIVYYFKVTKS